LTADGPIEVAPDRHETTGTIGTAAIGPGVAADGAADAVADAPAVVEGVALAAGELVDAAPIVGVAPADAAVRANGPRPSA
jgi:hypothetical protein